MNPYQAMVQDWHVVMSVPVGNYDSPKASRSELRAELVREEAAEALVEIRKGDLLATMKELCDVAYVCFGAAVEWGIRLGDLSLRPERFAVALGARPSMPSGKERTFWVETIERRAAKAVAAILDPRLGPHAALAPANSLTAACMTLAVDCGVSFLECFTEVNASNMSKAPPTYRADGKVGKGPNYRPADLRPILVQCGWKEAA